jgi:hypothetical protein
MRFSLKISTHRATHSLQMKTPSGPATTRARPGVFPQNEHVPAPVNPIRESVGEADAQRQQSDARVTSRTLAQTRADLKVQSWLGVARRVIDLLERPFRREPVADRAPERNVEFSSTRAHPRLHVGVSRSGAIGIDVDAAHDIVALWL